MHRRIPACPVCWAVLCLLLVGLVAPDTVKADTSVERELIERLGLSDDPEDADIIKLLDDRMTRIPAMSLIRRRRISSAVPKLLEIMDEKNTQPAAFLDKLNAAETLCLLGNMEWIGQIRALLSDADVNLSVSRRIQIAGLLARGGDYSQFQIVKSNVANETGYIRRRVVRSLGDFRRRSREGEQAVELLLAVAMGDRNVSTRDAAITSLEKMARERPDIKPQIVSALEANLNCTDEKFRRFCQGKLEMYRRDALTPEEVMAMLDDRTQFLTAISVITRRKLQSTAPKLLQMIGREETGHPTKMLAARTLLRLDNREWIEPVRVLSSDPNLTTSRRLSVAGLLAEGGDYSQFDFVADGLENGDLVVRQKAAGVLVDFGGKTSPVSLQVAQLLEAAASHDVNSAVRMVAIASLERMVAEKPDTLPGLLRALEANVNSDNAYLRKQCEARLKKYREAPKQE